MARYEVRFSSETEASMSGVRSRYAFVLFCCFVFAASISDRGCRRLELSEEPPPVALECVPSEAYILKA